MHTLLRYCSPEIDDEGRDVSSYDFSDDFNGVVDNLGVFEVRPASERCLPGGCAALKATPCVACPLRLVGGLGAHG